METAVLVPKATAVLMETAVLVPKDIAGLLDAAVLMETARPKATSKVVKLVVLVAAALLETARPKATADPKAFSVV
tara:strand:- start:201 stop:428 length:228 start_codon:yes stop_codon:yes gene_type:complete